MARYEELAGKRVMVTGAASGIGLATAQRFASEGARVAILDINRPALEKVLAENPVFEGGLVADVSDAKSVSDAFAELDGLFGGIDVLVANAGISVRSDFVDITPEQWDKVLGINLRGIFLCSREAARRMLARCWVRSSGRRCSPLGPMSVRVAFTSPLGGYLRLTSTVAESPRFSGNCAMDSMTSWPGRNSAEPAIQ